MSAGLEAFRLRLDQLDEQIVRLLGERFDVCRDVARYKTENSIDMMQPARVAEVRARYLARGAAVDLPPKFTAALFDLIIAATCRVEDELMGTPEHQRGDPVAPTRDPEDEVISKEERAGRT